MTAYIVDHCRTPRARRKGKFSGVHPVDLLTYPLQEVVKKNNIDPQTIEDVAVGCVTQVHEQAWCIARSAILACGWPITVPGVTINRLCASSQQACNFIASSITADNYDLAIAGGIEHMTRVPMFSDVGGEESPLLQKHYPNLENQGLACEKLIKHFDISKTAINEYALRSQQLAASAQTAGHLKSLVSVPYTDEQGNQVILSQDDNLRPDTTLEALNNLNPVFREDGYLTAGNSSAIVDGACSILLASENALKKHNLNPRAKIVAQSVVGSDPYIMLSGPIAASRSVLKKAGLNIDDINLWEINEAFAPVVLATIQELDINPDLVNVNGGAIALGHPLGATGGILIGTLIDELERRQLRYGLVTMCIGLGMGIATIFERTN